MMYNEGDILIATYDYIGEIHNCAFYQVVKGASPGEFITLQELKSEVVDAKGELWMVETYKMPVITSLDPITYKKVGSPFRRKVKEDGLIIPKPYFTMWMKWNGKAHATFNYH